MFNYKILEDEMENLKNEGLLINTRTLESPQGAWIVINGKRVLNFCSNNYLGFANDERLKQAAIKATQEWGVGPGAVRTIAGTMKIHEELEKTLAEFKGADATIFLQSGFIANQAAIPTVFGDENDAIISDELNHASIIDGVRLSKAKRYVYKHNDMNELEARLKEARYVQKARRILIVTDGVFSMDGDIAPLPEIVDLADKYDAAVMVDDAHGEGVLGRSGRGIVDHFGLHGRVDMEIGTLSKAFGVLGGYIAGKETLVRYLKQKARPFLFSTGLTPADVAACLEAVKILQESDERVKRLWDNAAYFKGEMKKLGFDLGVSQTPITPVMLYDAKVASQFSRELFEEGIFAQAIGYPTVPKGKARIRVMISATHSKDDIDFGLEKFEKVGKKLAVI